MRNKRNYLELDLVKRALFETLRFCLFFPGINNVRDPFSWDITGRNILMMIIQGFLFFFITVMIEYRFFLPRRFVRWFSECLFSLYSCERLCQRCLSFAEDSTTFNNGKAKQIVVIDLNYPNRFVRNCKLPLLLLFNTKKIV